MNEVKIVKLERKIEPKSGDIFTKDGKIYMLIFISKYSNFVVDDFWIMLDLSSGEIAFRSWISAVLLEYFEYVGCNANISITFLKL